MTYRRNVGMLTVEKAPGEELKKFVKSLVAAGETFQVLSNKTLKETFPELSFLPHYSGVLEHSAGILRADKCLRVLQVEGFLLYRDQINLQTADPSHPHPQAPARYQT